MTDSPEPDAVSPGPAEGRPGAVSPRGYGRRPDAVLPRRIERRWRVAAVVGACAVLVAAVFVAYAEAPLVSPPTLAHDPVPAEQVRWRIPDGCGVGTATLNALVPEATAKSAGEDGSCEWVATDTATSTERHLKMGVAAYHGDAGASSVAGAIEDFARLPRSGLTARPVTGLGDEALIAGGTRNSEVSAESIERGAVRTGNVTVSAEYSVDTGPSGGEPPSPRRLQAGLLRALTDTARALGAPAAPKVAPAPHPAKLQAPRSVCDAVPSGLRDRLVPKSDDGFRDTRPTTSDPLGALATSPDRVRGCETNSTERDLKVAIITGTAPMDAFAIRDEYLHRYLEARADQPISRTDEKYFHAVSNLGDQAFASYLQEDSAFAGGQNTAVVVARSGTALITVTYGPRTTDEAPTGKPLTRKEAVNGAYAVAVEATDAVRRS